MVPSRPFTVVLHCGTPARLVHLEALLTGAGYRTVPAGTADSSLARTGADALVVDLVGTRELDPRAPHGWSGRSESLLPTLLVVPVRLADRREELAPGTAVHVDGSGGHGDGGGVTTRLCCSGWR